MTRERLHRRLHHINDIPRLHGVSPAIFDLDDSQNTERKQTEKRWQQREHVFDIGLLKVGNTRKKGSTQWTYRKRVEPFGPSLHGNQPSASDTEGAPTPAQGGQLSCS